MMDTSGPLLRRTARLPGESLPSLLERLVQLNHYAGTTIWTRLVPAPQAGLASPEHPGCPRYGATFLRLAHLTQLPVAELLAASAHAFTPALAPGRAASADTWCAVPQEPRRLPSRATLYLRPAVAAQYCPHCLRPTPYHQLGWLPAPVTICPQHHCLLVDRCPGCQRPVTLVDIVRGRCGACYVDLSAAPAVSVAGDTLGLRTQQWIQAWFGLAPAPPADMPAPWPMQAPALRYRLFELLYRRLLGCRTAWASWPTPLPGLDEQATHIGTRARRLAPNETYYLYRAAYAALLDWPAGLFHYLDAYSGRTTGAPDACQTKHLGTLQRDWLAPAWRAADSDLCIRTLVDYGCDRGLPFTISLVTHLKDVPWFVDRTGLWTAGRTAQALDLPIHSLSRLYPNGPLGPCRWPLKGAGETYFERSQVLALQQRWRRGWSLADTCCWLGLDEGTVQLLVARRLLAPLAPSGDRTPDWLFDRDAVTAFFDRVAARTIYLREGRKLLTYFNDAVRRLSYAAVDPAALLQGILDGAVPAYRQEPQLAALRDVCLVDAQLYSIPDLLPARPAWVNGCHFVWDIGLSVELLVHWVETGQLQPQGGTGCYFNIDRLQELAAPYLTLPSPSRTIFETAGPLVGQSHYL